MPLKRRCQYIHHFRSTGICCRCHHGSCWNAGIKVIVAITEEHSGSGYGKGAYIQDRDCTLIGPNCPGIITPGEAKGGYHARFHTQKSHIGIVSRSGTLTYEAVDQVTESRYGTKHLHRYWRRSCSGTTTLDAVKLLMADDDTEGSSLIGEIGGTMEAQAAQWIKRTAPNRWWVSLPDKRHRKEEPWVTPAPLPGGKDDTAAAKMEIMRACGIHVAETPAVLGEKMRKRLHAEACVMEMNPEECRRIVEVRS